ncbi:hypothetical protein BDV26DRAFT_262662 [Aspergillus bertholletiae]|uniref:Uncharacterized protein n=1 Tax=Aspergillus bertholletiae TaxID=1226010 RepID=A0A5N7B851_9EURO|nr:hypothetical protein BDV26DRAFT_262662 [Aspergillus bertholletiae]
MKKARPATATMVSMVLTHNAFIRKFCGHKAFLRRASLTPCLFCLSAIYLIVIMMFFPFSTQKCRFMD